MLLENKTAIVTGGANGIGRGISLFEIRVFSHGQVNHVETFLLEGFAGLPDFIYSQTVTANFVFAVIIAKSTLVFTVSGKVDETIQKYSVPEIVIPYFQGCRIQFLHFFFGF